MRRNQSSISGLSSRRRVVLVAIVAVLCASLAFVSANWWVLRQANGRIALDIGSAPAMGVAIVPGAAVWKDRPSITLVDRLDCARRLFQSGKVNHVLISGDHGSAHYDEVAAMKKWLRERGVPSHRVIADHAGFRTLDTMARAQRLFGVKRATICTQGFHLPRSIFLARRVGIDARGVVADRRQYAAHHYNQWRERLARLMAVYDVYIAHTQPRFWGKVETQLQPSDRISPGQSDLESSPSRTFVGEGGARQD